MHELKHLLAPVLLVGCVGCVGSPGYPPSREDASSTFGPSMTSGISATGVLNTSAETTPTGGSTTEQSPSSDSTGDPLDPFVFSETEPSEYVQVERAGLPGANAALNVLGDKDAYNFATPADDANLQFLSNILESLETLHLGIPDMQSPDNTGLDDDLQALGFSPCTTPPLAMDDCDDQVGLFMLPDVLEIRTDDPPGFPNGRMLADPVMDIILAIILLDIEPSGVHSLFTFLDLDGDGKPGPSLNPLANDVEFPASFPYLAPAHGP